MEAQVGLSTADIPEVGGLTPLERRALARWLRTVLERGQARSDEEVCAALEQAGYAPRVSVAALEALGWLERSAAGLHADTFKRRLAAGAVAATRRMSEQEAYALADVVRLRAAAWENAGVPARPLRLLRVVLYGSAVRSLGNLKPDVGDLDLALEVQVDAPELRTQLLKAPPAQRWRRAVELSGLSDWLMQGDDRITVAGSLHKVLSLFERQSRGLDLPADGREPCAVVLWEHPSYAGLARASRPSDWGGDKEMVALAPQDCAFLPALCKQTLARQARAMELTARLAQGGG